MYTTTSRYSTAWEDAKMINSVKQHQILYSYSLHKKNLDNIRLDPNLKMVDNTEPQTFKLLSPPTQLYKSKSTKMFSILSDKKQSKAQKDKELEVNLENGSLVSRMKQISEKGSMYNQSFIDKHLFKSDKSLNAPFRRKETYKVNSENLSLNNRLERVQSTISFGNYAKLYDKTKQYKNNLTRSSRRIFNCFVKTDTNNELLATTSTAYGRLFTGSQSTNSRYSKKIDLIQDASKNKKNQELSDNQQKELSKKQEIFENQQKKKKEQEQLNQKQNISEKERKEQDIDNLKEQEDQNYIENELKKDNNGSSLSKNQSFEIIKKEINEINNAQVDLDSQKNIKELESQGYNQRSEKLEFQDRQIEKEENQKQEIIEQHQQQQQQLLERNTHEIQQDQEDQYVK